VGTPRHDFYQVKLMHEFLSKKFADLTGTLSLCPLRNQPMSTFTSRGRHGPVPKLLRALGLVIDLEIPSLAIAALANIRVRPSFLPPTS